MRTRSSSSGPGPAGASPLVSKNQADQQGGLARHLRVMHHDLGFERTRSVHALDDGISVVSELHDRAGRVHAHHANEAAQDRRVEALLALCEQERQRLVRRHRAGGWRRMAQVVVAIDQRHHARRHAHAIAVHALREARAVAAFVVLPDHQQRPRRQPHALAQGHAEGDMFAVGCQFAGAVGVVRALQAWRQVELADVVRHRAHSEVTQVVLAQAAQPAQQQGDHADVQCVAGPVGPRLCDGTDRQLARTDHLVDQRARQCRHSLSRSLRIGCGLVGSDAPFVRGLAVLTLDEFHRRVLGRERAHAPVAQRPGPRAVDRWRVLVRHLTWALS
jgi:hypothetical protein